MAKLNESQRVFLETTARNGGQGLPFTVALRALLDVLAAKDGADFTKDHFEALLRAVHTEKHDEERNEAIVAAIDSLDELPHSPTGSNAGLDRMIEGLREQISEARELAEESQDMIAVLRGELEEKDAEILSLKAEIEAKKPTDPPKSDEPAKDAQ